MQQYAVKIYLRTRPSEAFASELLQVNQDSKTVTLVQGARSSGLPTEKSGPPQQYQFKFDGILHNASQEDVFELCASDVISAALEGYNGTIMCYGQTGAGKTYTMAGTRSSYRGRGLVPRCIASSLARLAAAPGLAAWAAHISYLEIYNEALYDLLDINSQPHELSLYEDGRGHVQVSGLRKVQVRSEAEALALFFEGESNRVIGEHQLNRASSRSHSIFMVQLELTPQAAEGSSLHSKLFLVDLAGSERVSKTRSEGLVLKEAGHINRSLALLEQVVRAASERGRCHVPYRSCKLTHVLKDSLGGNCRTVLIANVWGDQAQLGETLSTCRFSARMARLVCEVHSNVQQEGGARVRELQREVQELKEELAMMELMAQFQQQQQPASSSSFEPYSELQRQKLRESVRVWLLQPDGASNGSSSSSSVSLTPLPLSSVRQLRELLLAFKDIAQQQVQQLPNCTARSRQGSAASSSQQPCSSSSSSSSNSWQQQQYSHQNNGVGDAGDGSQHDIMMAAPDDARPSAYSTIQQPQQQQQQRENEPAGPGPGSISLQLQQRGSRLGTPSRLAQTGSSNIASYPPSGYSSVAGNGGVLPVPPDRASALEVYRAGPGAERAALLNDNHARLKAAKRRAKELGLTLNGLKVQLDEARVKQEALKAARLASEQEEPQALSPEEYQLVVDIRDIKAQYRDGHAELQLVRDEVQYTSSLLDTCKAELATDFEAWAAQAYGELFHVAAGSLMLPGSSRPDSAASSTQVNSSLYGAAAPHDQHQDGVKAVGAGGFSSKNSSLHRRQNSTPPLASLVGALQLREDADDPQAAAYYSAQQNLSGKVHRQGPQKKYRGERGTFTSTGRSAINDVADFQGCRV